MAELRLFPTSVQATLQTAAAAGFDAVTVVGQKEGKTTWLIGIDVTAQEPPSDPYARLLTGYSVSTATLPTAHLPVNRGWYNPQYKTAVRRVADSAAVTNPGTSLMPVYSRIQAYNADDSRVLLLASNGWWHVFNRAADGTFSYLKRLDTSPNPAGDCELQWHPTDPAIARYTAQNGGLIYRQINVATGVVALYFDLQQVLSVNGDQTVRSLTSVFPSAARFWTKGEGSPSRDHRYWGGQVEDANFNFLGFAIYDTLTGDVRTLTAAQYGGGRPDHCSMSVNGGFFVASSDEPGIGTRAYRNDFSSYRQVHHKSEHSDLAVMPNGDEVYVSVNFQDNEGNLFFYNLTTGVKTELTHLHAYPTSHVNHITPTLHISGRCYDKPSWVMISTYSATNQYWADNKILMVELADNGKIVNVGHTLNKHANYFSECHGPVNRDGTKFLFGSTGQAGGSVEPYEIDLNITQ